MPYIIDPGENNIKYAPNGPAAVPVADPSSIPNLGANIRVVAVWLLRPFATAKG